MPLAKYLPGFFYTEFESDLRIDDIGEIMKNDRHKLLFLHEYIHFLQNVTTTQGTIFMAYQVELMKDFSEVSISNSCIKIPHEPKNKKVAMSHELYKVYCATPLNAPRTTTIIEYREDDVMIYGVKTGKMIMFKTSNDDSEYVLSAAYILESMAYSIEKAIFPDIKESPVSFKYNAVKAFVDYIYPKFNTSETVIACLCDVVLLTTNNVGYHLVKLLEHLRSKSLLFTNYIDLFNISCSMIGKSPKFIIDEFIKWHKLGFDQVKDYFTTSELDMEKSWVNHLYDISKSIRLDNIDFIEILCLDRSTEERSIFINKEFTSIFCALGTGSLKNNSDHLYVHIPQSIRNLYFQPDRLIVINSILRLAYNGTNHQNFGCSLSYLS